MFSEIGSLCTLDSVPEPPGVTLRPCSGPYSMKNLNCGRPTTSTSPIWIAPRRWSDVRGFKAVAIFNTKAIEPPSFRDRAWDFDLSLLVHIIEFGLLGS